ncbi:MAG: carbonic anhydrase [Sideroxydans sp.]
MDRLFKLSCICLLALAIPAHALDAHGGKDQSAEVSKFLSDLKSDNSVYMVTHKIEFFAGLAKGQTPKATIVTCSDSRVQANMFDRAPEGDLFTIRNIGNQLATAEGSVEYGVHHLHTPILMFIGHSRCGAIAAVGGNYSKESAAIKKELDTIGIPKDIGNLEGVTANVHNQVSLAMIKFSEEVSGGHLTVIGAVMDFADDVHQGAGKFHVININGEKDPDKLVNVSALIAKHKAKPVAAKVEKKVDSHDKPAGTETGHAKPDAHDDHAATAEHAPAHH